MAIDREEWARRRALRQQQQQQRKAKNRRLWIRLGIAGAVLVVCGILIVVLSLRPANPSQDPTSPPPADTVIHLAAAGDLNITDAVVASGGSAYDYTEIFGDVAHILADADIATLNFEGSLQGTPYGTESASAPQSMMQALDRAGVDLIQLANSYAINHGVSGLADTIDGVRAAGMEPLGVYANEKAYQAGQGYVIRDVGGIQIAFVAFTKGMDGMALPEGSENCVNVLYEDYSSTYQKVDEAGILRVLNAANAQSPDLVVALLHWGSEFNDTISESQSAIVTLMQDNGVDAIIGTHSHYVQKMTYNEENGNFVAYSLGDFFGDATRAGSEYSVILDLEITKSGVTGETRVTGYSYTPIFTVTDKNAPMRVVRIREAIEAYKGLYIQRVSQEAYTAMEYALERIAARTSGAG